MRAVYVSLLLFITHFKFIKQTCNANSLNYYFKKMYKRNA